MKMCLYFRTNLRCIAGCRFSHIHTSTCTHVIIPSSSEFAIKYAVQTVIFCREFRLNECTGVCSDFYAYPDEILIMNGRKKPGLLVGITFYKYEPSP